MPKYGSKISLKKKKKTMSVDDKPIPFKAYEIIKSMQLVYLHVFFYRMFESGKI